MTRKKYKPKYLWVAWVTFTEGGRGEFLDDAILRYDKHGELHPEWIGKSIAIGRWAHIIELKRYMDGCSGIKSIKMQKIPIDENGIVGGNHETQKDVADEG